MMQVMCRKEKRSVIVRSGYQSWKNTKCSVRYYTVSQKMVQNCFCHNFVKFPQTVIIFGTLIAERTHLCDVQHCSLCAKN